MEKGEIKGTEIMKRKGKIERRGRQKRKEEKRGSKGEVK